ncbi:hypothetical protein KNHN1_17180 [Pseudomonas guariconensis]
MCSSGLGKHPTFWAEVRAWQMRVRRAAFTKGSRHEVGQLAYQTNACPSPHSGSSPTRQTDMRGQ